MIDPESEAFTVIPIEREIQFHYPLLSLYPNVLEVTGFGFSPNMWAEIRLVHPLPASGIDVFDPRVIVLLPVTPGASFHYPEFDIISNNKVIVEPDAIRLFNDLGGSIAGNVNPFIAFFKDQPHRVWSSTEKIVDTRLVQMDIDGFIGSLEFILVVDVSTNYPEPPQPIVDNAPEPYEIDAEISDGLTTQGGSADVVVRLKHWRSLQDVGGVLIESPSLLNDVMPIQFYS